MWTGGRGFGPEKRRSLKAREFWDKYRPKDVPSEAERASRKTYPSSSGVTWTTIPSLKYAGPTDVSFNCPITACQLLMTATLGNVGLPIVLDVVEPRVVCTHAGWYDEHAALLDAGFVTMRLYYAVEPRSVSFEGLHMEEVPVPPEDELPDGVVGYFREVSCPLHRTHDDRMGAGDWVAVKTNGIWRMDEAHAPVLPHPWSEGTLRWAVPMAWGYPWASRDAEDIVLVEPNPCALQEYVIDEWGTVSISKSGHVIERSIADWIWLDGSRVKP